MAFPLPLQRIVDLRAGEYGAWVDDVENLMYRASMATGLGLGTNPPHIYWFRRPIVHVVEHFGFAAFLILLFWLSGDYYRRAARSLRVPRSDLPDSLLDKLIGLTYAAIFVSQVVFKAVRPAPWVQIWWLIMPCHLITLAWAYVFLCKKKGNEHRRKWCVYLASVITACHWAPVSAAAFPDTSDHQYPVEKAVFVVHHTMLVLTPVYWAARYRFLPMTEEFFIHVTALATFVNVGPYMLVSYLSGLNVNYMLAPPKPLLTIAPHVWDTPWYRVYTVGLLIMATIAFRASIGALGAVLKDVGKQIGGGVIVSNATLPSGKAGRNAAQPALPKPDVPPAAGTAPQKTPQAAQQRRPQRPQKP